MLIIKVNISININIFIEYYLLKIKNKYNNK